MNRVVIHIDRLVLNGSRREDRHAIALGLQNELGRAFGDPEAIRQLSGAIDVGRLQVGRVHIAHGSKPQRIGEKVARGIRKEITR